MEDVELHHSYESIQREDARQILRQLALGIDPRTGSPIRGQGLIHDPLVIRALFMGIEALTEHDIPPVHDTTKDYLRRAGQPWSQQEDEQLRQEFSAAMNIQIITESHYRTQGAIASRLVHLKLITHKDEVRDLLAWS